MWQGVKRRSLGLALIVVGFLCQWVAWGRIDRAAFQYHYYTSLPFVLLALAYFVAELWHGASRRTWLVARIIGAVALLGPPAVWVFHRPLCWFVGVDRLFTESVSNACPAVIPEADLTARSVLMGAVVLGGLVLLVREFLALGREPISAASDDDGEGPIGRSWRAALERFGLGPLGPLVAVSIGSVAAVLVVALVVPDITIVRLQSFWVEPIALTVLIALIPVAAVIVTARDARRFVGGLLFAAVGWFVVAYPNLSGLPLPGSMVNMYQGTLPTYLYNFQFPVSMINRNQGGPPLFDAGTALILVALTIACLVIAYSAWVWRIALAERELDAAQPEDGVAAAGIGSGDSGSDDAGSDDPGSDDPTGEPPTSTG
jgi:hypothetical protein